VEFAERTTDFNGFKLWEVYGENTQLELLSDYHLGIRPSGNLPPQKVLPLYEGVGSIPEIFKIYVFFLFFFFSFKKYMVCG
jgi:hypothetical protein